MSDVSLPDVVNVTAAPVAPPLAVVSCVGISVIL